MGTDYHRYNTCYREPRVPLDLNVEVGAMAVPIFVSSVPESAELWVAFNHSIPGDIITFAVNQQLLEPSPVDVQASLQPAGFEVTLARIQSLRRCSPDAQSPANPFRFHETNCQRTERVPPEAYRPSCFFHSGQMLCICHASSFFSTAFCPWARRETPMLSSRPG